MSCCVFLRICLDVFEIQRVVYGVELDTVSIVSRIHYETEGYGFVVGECRLFGVGALLDSIHQTLDIRKVAV